MSSNNSTSFKSSLLVPVSGGLSGIVEACSTHPLDRIKTEVQRQMLEKNSTIIKSHTSRSPLISSILTIYQTGGLSNFYKGIIPRLYGILPMRVVFWGALESGNKMVVNEKNTFIKYTLPGILAGSIQTFIDNPIEVLKIRLMTSPTTAAPSSVPTASPAIAPSFTTSSIVSLNSSASYSTSATASHQSSAISSIKNLYKGFFPCFYRNIIFTVTLSTTTRTFKDQNAFVVGAFGGLLGSILSHPFDVVKTELQRIQTSKVNTSIAPFSSSPLIKKTNFMTFQTYNILKNIFESNPKQLFSGLSMRCLLSFMNMGIGFYCLKTIQDELRPFFD